MTDFLVFPWTYFQLRNDSFVKVFDVSFDDVYVIFYFFVNFRKISVRKTIWDLEFSEHLL